MLSNFLKDNMRFLNQAPSWEESIKTAAQPLVEKSYINLDYIQAMIENVQNNGPYIIIVPEIAMPHASTDKGVNQTGMSFLKLQEPVTFPGGQRVKLLFVLAATDSTTHLDLLSDLSSLLIDEGIREQLKKVANEDELLRLVEMVE